MSTNICADIMQFLDGMIGLPLCYGVKSPDVDLYDLGFGKLMVDAPDHKRKKRLPMYVLHVVCRFKIIWRIGEKHVETFREDTNPKVLRDSIDQLIGMTIRRISLSEKNDLWLDVGDAWIVFATFENGEESWRLFMPHTNKPHLVASNYGLDFSV